MTIFCTYCSAEKDQSEGELPSIERYQGPRLQSVYSASKNLGLRFLILSGKYGILEPSDPILNYDYVLKSSEVERHSKLVAGQLKALGVKDLIFFTRKALFVKPYSECIRLATEKAGVELYIVYLTMYDA